MTRPDRTCRRRVSAPRHGGTGALAQLPDLRLTLLIGAYAQGWHLGGRESVTARVAGWRDHAPAVFPFAASVLAQYRVAQAQPVVRGRASAGPARPREGGSGVTTTARRGIRGHGGGWHGGRATALVSTGWRPPSCSFCWRPRPRATASVRASSRVEDGAFVCVFDREERLSGFAGGGRALCVAVGQGAGGHADGAGARAGRQSWLRGRDAAGRGGGWRGWRSCWRRGPTRWRRHPRRSRHPARLPEALLTALDARLASAAGLARRAALVAVGYAGGGPRAPAGLHRCAAGRGAVAGAAGGRGAELFGAGGRHARCRVLPR